ncbi:2'-5' RNA ligase family protein [Xanthomonas theicola]|uniref:RNA 2',3'-cyclic phosphodiesterase n=1 Tax=Xanthomonas theicola TaxID=56464 RepID=A0A2S6ZC14_9XANT|nr:2'-5' RNA ligase family protein [Xanthomonas theicola]PPT87043.1 RNA 2',3'-cyclic phosphodiesterase [Xanthomonas theicola]QNH25305.1 RNA 2',3'-cyclic phosphodiesterase [Xanthomonas theicola]
MTHPAFPAGAQFPLGFAGPASRENLCLALLPDPATVQRAFARGAPAWCAWSARPGAAPGRLHVTLHHLGEYAGIPPRLLLQARAAGQALASAPFELGFHRAARFGGRARARPLVLRGNGEPPPLRQRRAALQRQLGRHGLATHASVGYLPHITLAYDERAVPLQPVPELRWTLATLSLIRSVQGHGRYLHEATWALSAHALVAPHDGAAPRR